MLAMGNVHIPPPLGPATPPNTYHTHSLTQTNASPQILFLIGLTIIIGPRKTALFFFARRQKLKGTAAFFAGLALILFLRWPLVGFLVELYGIAVLFGDFLGTAASFARNVPVVGPYVGMAVDRAGGLGLGQRRNADLPV